MTPVRLAVTPSSVTRRLVAAVAVLLLAHLAGQFAKLELGHRSLKGLVPLFDMDQEGNAPTYFSVFLLLGAAAVVAVIATVHRARSAAGTTKWRVLAAGFIGLAVDEGFMLHERLVQPMKSVLAGSGLVTTADGRVVYGVLYFAWVPVGVVAVAVVGVYFSGFLKELPPRTRRGFLLAAALYLGGALGVELFSGRHVELHGRENWAYVSLVAAEETLEMLGVVVFIRALLTYCADRCPGVTFVVKR